MRYLPYLNSFIRKREKVTTVQCLKLHTTNSRQWPLSEKNKHDRLTMVHKILPRRVNLDNVHKQSADRRTKKAFRCRCRFIGLTATQLAHCTYEPTSLMCAAEFDSQPCKKIDHVGGWDLGGNVSSWFSNDPAFKFEPTVISTRQRIGRMPSVYS